MAEDIIPRVAVLEQIARETASTLADIRTDLRDIRQAQRTDFRWTLGIILALTLAVAGLYQRLGSFDARIAAIDTQVTGIASTLHQRTGG